MTQGSNPALTYGFDPSGDLSTLPTGASASYDNAGELTSSTLSGASTAYAYNAGGERLTATQGASATATVTWNGAGELASYSGGAAQMSAASYTGDGLRAAATFTPSGGSAVNAGYVWDSAQQAPQLPMDSINAYIYAGDDAPAEQVNLVTGTVTYLLGDALGSVRGTISSSGTLTGATSYDAWGNPATAGGLIATTPFGFGGGYTDPTGLVYLQHRYYDPQTGQFTSVDPQVAQTLAPYAYTNGDPVSQDDPSGEHPCVGNIGASWGQSSLEWCVGAAVVTAYVCGNVHFGGAKTDYQWYQWNWGRRHVTVLSWYPTYYGYTCSWFGLWCTDTKIQQPQFEMRLYTQGGQLVYRQWSTRDDWEPSTDWFAPGGWESIPVEGGYGKLVPRGSYIDFYLCGEFDRAVRASVTGAHAGAELWTH